jgi:fluoroacetyl-CoA thioesterase
MGAIAAGLTGDVEMIVTEDDTAERWGSGLVPVLGTPTLVAIMENAAVRALNGHLPPGQTSVGGRMDIRHLAPTPVGMVVRARAELMEVSGRQLVFQVEAWDEVEKIGEATHERFVVDEKRFIAEAEAKAAAEDED